MNNSFTIYTKPPKGFQPTAQICQIGKLMPSENATDKGDEWKGEQASEEPNIVIAQLWARVGSKPVWVILPSLMVDELVFVEPKETNIIAATALPVKLHGGRN